ncbi:RNA polymerase sigma factor [Micromonospora sp. NPDC050417]|uniref:RNA polymerase sigma factor n=1 Tax=Micromonospora sp. NPDC050417 TaxID=3364280 RepID=UPI00378E4E2A
MFSTLESDSELALAAQSGDATALGVLVARHQAGMQAVALSLLGYGPDAEDAVQDAILTALGRIGDLRDPAAVGPWLRAIVRNNARMRLRRSRTVPVGDLEALALPATDPTPEELLDGRSMRDWVWHAMGELSEPIRLVTLLRYFSGASSYEQIAALCGVPVGTVRSRLSQARSKLTTALQETADEAHDDAAAQAAARRREAEQGLATAYRGEFSDFVRETWWSDAEFVTPDGQVAGGPDFAIWGMNKDLNDGVRQRIANVVTSGNVMIWEADLISPPDNPTHCPPSAIWLHTLREGRTARMRLYHPEPTLTSDET